MKNSTIGMLLVIAGVLSIFIKHDNSWIISALLIGGGSGIFFGKIIKIMIKKNKIMFLVNGSIGALIFYYFVRKIQIYYNVNIEIDGYGLAGAVWYGIGLGFIFGVKFIRVEEILAFLKKK